MPSDEARYRLATDFEGVAQESRNSGHWYNIDWRACATVKTAYILSACCFFVLLFIYGAISMSVTENCRVMDSSGRCCRCLRSGEAVPPEFQQTMPREKTYNDVYHGVILMVCACFGLMYVYLGISEGNRFLFICMFATQGIDILRLLLDLAFEPPEHSSRRLGRQIVLGLAAVMMLVSWSLLHRVYKLFGWRFFRGGGARLSVREMYKTYQRYKAYNLLDLQASVVLFLVLAFFVESTRKDGYWVLIFVCLCEVTATRCALRYLKLEDCYGAALSAASKCIAIFWWTMTLAEYAQCWRDFQESRRGTSAWFLASFFPSLDSVASYYAGQECRPSHTAYDSRVLELLAVNYIFAVIFRIASLVIGLRVVQNFGKGMVNVFYVYPGPICSGRDDTITEIFTATRQGDALEGFDADASQSMKEVSQGRMEK